MKKSKSVRKKFKNQNLYDQYRKEQLLEDNEKEDRIIKNLSKRLKLKHSKRDSKSSKQPLWVYQCGFDYILDFDKTENDNEEVNNSAIIGINSLLSKSSSALDLSLPPKKKKKVVDIYGQNTTKEDSGCESEQNDLSVPIKKKNSSGKNVRFSEIHSKINDTQDVFTDNDKNDNSKTLTKLIRNLLNRISESQMLRVLNELTDLFANYPRALVRSIIIEETCNLLESIQVGHLSKMNWLHQEVAVCLACLNICLQMKYQNNQFIGYLIEYIIRNKLFSHENQISANLLSSISMFVAFLYRFGVISGVLILDILEQFTTHDNPDQFKAAHSICIAVGVNLRKFNLTRCQKIIQCVNEKLTNHRETNMEISFDLQGIIERLSEKYSKEECVIKSIHLRKMMRIWTKAQSITDDMCLSISLSDLLNTSTSGRWWLVGSAVINSTDKCLSANNSSKLTESVQSIIDPEVKDTAIKLGLLTLSRQHAFNILVTTPGGPDSVASALLNSCTTIIGPNLENNSNNNSNSGFLSREREVIHIILHCVMAEMPFNRFYPRVLGGILNRHRKYLMMIKCAFWDVLRNSDLTIDAKSNAGRALGLLCLVYDFPLTVLKNFNFGDNSDENIEFLKSLLIELCTGEYQKIFDKLMQLSTYTKLMRNCRIFMLKHFTNEQNQNIKAVILKLVSDMRDAESF